MATEQTRRPRVKRKRTQILRDTSRVITRLHVPDRLRIPKIIERVLDLDEETAASLLDKILHEFSDRHSNIKGVLQQHYEFVREHIANGRATDETKQLLIGAYFTKEYAIESAALFNPSIVPHPDQSDLPAGSLRYLMSLRATGEGHISSIVFREGIIDEKNSITAHPTGEFVETPEIQLDPIYNRHLFQLKLLELKSSNETTDRILVGLADEFSYNELVQSINGLISERGEAFDRASVELIYWLANCNYEIKFDSDHKLSERVIFPTAESETSGIEDARFVQFFDEDGDAAYYATYTAYNGVNILSQMIETRDFFTFKITTLNGHGIRNKGLALFPRKIKGMYAMLSRPDGENNHIMFSDHIRFWHESQLIQEPALPWEFIQIGNCGSPIEIEEGWLVLTHGVGPMRQYCISAVLLDLEDPTRLIARLNEPLLTPREEEREGYVPNVVYSCGGLIHNGELVIPYAMSDIKSGIATVGVRDLVDCMEPVESQRAAYSSSQGAGNNSTRHSPSTR